MINDAVLLSIHPEWAELIYAKKKEIEWRKSFPFNLNTINYYDLYSPYYKSKVTRCVYEKPIKIFLYETAPTQKITGYIIVNHVEKVQHLDLFQYNELNKGCVYDEHLIEYTKGASLFAWKIALACKFTQEIQLYRMTSKSQTIKRPPQSWCYCDDTLIDSNNRG